MVTAAGGKRRPSAVAKKSNSSSSSSSARRRRSRSRSRRPSRRPQHSPPLSPLELSQTLDLAASAVSLSLRFLSSPAAGADLLLLPSQSLALHSALASSALAFSRLLSLLPPVCFPSPLLPDSDAGAAASPSSSSSSSSSSSWFHRFLSSSSGGGAADRRWIEAFRMSKASFDLLLRTLSPSLPSAQPDCALAAALFRLAHAAPYSFLARRFALPSPDAACRSFYLVCKAVAARLGALIPLSTSADADRVAEGFARMSLHNCCGVLGFACFQVAGGGDCDAVTAQGLVDSEGRFLDVSVGWHGSMTPAEIVARSKLAKTQVSVLRDGPLAELSGRGSVPRYFLGGSCCQLLPWLITPFKGADWSSESSKEAIFNNVHAQGMDLAEGAFRSVRARWQLLSTGCWKEESVEALPYVVVASCLLHNYLMKCCEPMSDEIEMDIREPKFPDFEGKEDEGGARIRDALAMHLMKTTVSSN